MADPAAFNFTWGIAQKALEELGFVQVYGFMLTSYNKLGLSRDEFLCLTHLASFHYNSEKGKSRPSLVTIAKLMGYAHPNSVRRLVKSLENKEMIKVTRCPGYASTYDASPFAHAALKLWLKRQEDTLTLETTPTPQCETPPTSECKPPLPPGVGHKKKNQENKQQAKERKDPLSFELERKTASIQQNTGNYADPSRDATDVAETALTRFCAMQSEAPNDNERESMLRELAETLKPLRATVEEIGGAFDIMVKDFGYRIGNYNVFQDSFKRDLATCIRRARGKKQKQPDRYARTAELAAESQAALAERMAARGPPAEDDKWGQAVKGELQLQMTKATFDTWVKPAGMICEDGVFVVTVANAFAKDWLEDRLATTIKRTAVGVLGRAVEVRFEVEG